MKKLAHMDQLSMAFNSEGIVLENISINTATYKFGFTELNFTLCMGEEENRRLLASSWDFFFEPGAITRR